MDRLELKTASAKDVANLLDLTPHPEGGYFKETYRSEGKNEAGQSNSTAIYYLIVKGSNIAWHKLTDKDKFYHFHAGDPVEVKIASPDGVHQPSGTRIIGTDIFQGQEPQLLIPADHWMTAKCLGEWSLFGCTVSPGFEFADFVSAPSGWKPTEKVSE